MTLSELASFVALGGWGVSVVVGVLKARDWVEGVALAAMKSGAGRSIVTESVQDRHTRLEDKIDSLTKSVENVADRLEKRLESVAARMEARLDRLDKDTHAIDVRLSVIESSQP